MLLFSYYFTNEYLQRAFEKSRRLQLAMGTGNILFKSEIMLRELATMARVKKLVGSHILHAAYLVPCLYLLHDY